MSPDPLACVPFRRARFSTRLPPDRQYTASHFWVARVEAPPEAPPDAGAAYRVGFTQFATRMLGDLVEHEFEVKTGNALRVGQVIGWIEGFKAASDLYSVIEGAFVGGNPALAHDINLIDADPYGAGWLYEARGAPEPGCVDVDGYVAILNATIDKIQGKQP
jgi:glycine cleavage system H protein